MYYKNDLLTLIFLCTKKNWLLKENLRDWNSQMESESVDLQINEANDRDNKSKGNLISLATVT